MRRTTWMYLAVLAVAVPAAGLRPASAAVDSDTTEFKKPIVVDQIRFSMPREYDAVMRAAKGWGSLSEIEKYASEHGIRYTRVIVKISGMGGMKFPKLSDRELFCFEEGGMLYVIMLLNSKTAVSGYQQIHKLPYGIDTPSTYAPLGPVTKPVTYNGSIVLLDQVRFAAMSRSRAVVELLARAKNMEQVVTGLAAQNIRFTRGFTKAALRTDSLRRIAAMDAGGVFAVNTGEQVIISKIVAP